MHYITGDPAAIWDRMVDAYMDAGGDALYGGDEKEILLRGVQEIITICYARVDSALRMATLRYAQGEYLKLLGEERGCEYREALPARAEMEITLSAGYAPLEIEAGATFTSDGQRFFALDKALEYDGNAGRVRAGITAAEAGAAGNGLPSGTELRPVQALPMILKAALASTTAGGRDAEDMESYRMRVRQAPFLSVTTGPAQQYRAHALSAHSAVLDALAQRSAPGKVAIYLAIDKSANAQEVIKAVEDEASAQDVRPLTDDVKAQEAPEYAYKLDIEYVLANDGISTAKDALDAAVAEYKHWQEDALGVPFDAYQLISMLYRAGAKRATILDTSYMGSPGTPPSYHATDANQRVVGEVKLQEATQ